MNILVVVLISLVLLACGYLFYGRWLAKEWGVDPSRKTPSHELTDGMDYVPAKAPVLMGHHFSSIAGAGPINGPIQAAIFGWVPVLLWVVVGGISSAAYMISERCLLLFEIAVSPSARSFATLWDRRQSGCSLHLRG